MMLPGIKICDYSLSANTRVLIAAQFPSPFGERVRVRGELISQIFLLG